MVKEGLSVLGPDYTELLEKGFAEGWLEYMKIKENGAAPIPGARMARTRMCF